MNFNFAEWLKSEMTSCASIGGGITSTANIATFTRPLFIAPVKRNYPESDHKNKKKQKKKH